MSSWSPVFCALHRKPDAWGVFTQHSTRQLGNKDVERCSTPRWGLEAPDPTSLIIKEKVGVWGRRTQTGLGGSPLFSTNCRIL